MGITFQDAKALCEASRKGVSFEETLMIGRLSLNLRPSEIEFLRRFLAQGSKDAGQNGDYRFGEPSDSFLRQFLGAARIDVMDYSPYEGANVIHDLNQPVPEEWLGKYDAVIEAGSLEHIFHFPTAISNLMKVLKVGGSLFIKTPANNQCGHGFYQFSPELMFRIFTPENGFRLVRVALFESAYPSVELSPAKMLYEVTDPVVAGGRVGLVSKKPATLLVHAQKTADKTLFVRPPLQSDYLPQWERTDKTQENEPSWRSGLRSLFRKLPFSWRARINGYRERRNYSLSNSAFYKRTS